MGHNEIATRLKKDILGGRFDAAGRFPSEMELSAQFGVSRTTISRVMLDLKSMGLVKTRSGTRAKISKFAQAAAGRIGIIDPGSARGSVLSEICYQVERLGKQVGWEVLRVVLQGSVPEERAAEARDIARMFSESCVSGVIMQPLEFQKNSIRANQDILSSFEKRNMSVVLLDYDIVLSPERSKYDLVSIDNIAAGQIVALHLLREGCKRFCFLIPNRAPASLTERLHGVASAVIDAGIAWSHARNVLVAEISDRRRIASFMRTCRPDAVVCGNDALAMSLLASWGSLRLPKHPRIGGFDGSDSAIRAGIVSVRQPCKDLAYAAVQTLLSRIKNPKLPPRSVRLMPEAIAVR